MLAETDKKRVRVEHAISFDGISGINCMFTYNLRDAVTLLVELAQPWPELVLIILLFAFVYSRRQAVKAILNS